MESACGHPGTTKTTNEKNTPVLAAAVNKTTTTTTNKLVLNLYEAKAQDGERPRTSSVNVV